MSGLAIAVTPLTACAICSATACGSAPASTLTITDETLSFGMVSGILAAVSDVRAILSAVAKVMKSV